jgi:hypothetical protein
MSCCKDEIPKGRGKKGRREGTGDGGRGQGREGGVHE